MTVEVLISTLNNFDIKNLLVKMNIKMDALIINQCDEEGSYEFLFNYNKIRVILSKERGLSKSRNLAIKNSRGKICVIADDDVIYDNDAREKIIRAYNNINDADIIAFDVPSIDISRPTRSLKQGRVNFWYSMRISSFQITFKRESIIEKGILFNEIFGSGSLYPCGEENIFLAQALKKGLKIYYIKDKIAVVNHSESQWFDGYYNEKILKAKGACFYAMNPLLSNFLILQFSVRKKNLFRHIGLLEAIKYMRKGLNEYKNLLKKINISLDEKKQS